MDGQESLFLFRALSLLLQNGATLSECGFPPEILRKINEKSGKLLEFLTRTPTEELNALHESAERGDVNQVKELIKKGFPVNARNAADDTPAHLAARQMHKNTLAALEKAGANLNAKDSVGHTSLSLLLFQGGHTEEDGRIKFDFARFLKENSERATGFVTTLKFLIKRGVPLGNNYPSIGTKDAARPGQPGLLIEYISRASLSALIRTRPPKESAKDNESQKPDKPINAKTGCNLNRSQAHIIAFHLEPTSLRLLAKQGVDLNTPDDNGSSPLCSAFYALLVAARKLPSFNKGEFSLNDILSDRFFPKEKAPAFKEILCIFSENGITIETSLYKHAAIANILSEESKEKIKAMTAEARSEFHTEENASQPKRTKKTGVMESAHIHAFNWNTPALQNIKNQTHLSIKDSAGLTPFAHVFSGINKNNTEDQRENNTEINFKEIKRILSMMPNVDLGGFYNTLHFFSTKGISIDNTAHNGVLIRDSLGEHVSRKIRSALKLLASDMSEIPPESTNQASGPHKQLIFSKPVSRRVMTTFKETVDGGHTSINRKKTKPLSA